jgi:hypothetical protein
MSDTTHLSIEHLPRFVVFTLLQLRGTRTAQAIQEPEVCVYAVCKVESIVSLVDINIRAIIMKVIT